MKNEDLFLTWAPPGGPWSDWAKPVAFAQVRTSSTVIERGAVADWRSLPVDWLPTTGDTALVIDLPGTLSITYGLAVAERGWWPVPLHNACTGPAEVVDMHAIIRALHQATYELREIKRRDDPAPAFLLDSDRMPKNKSPKPGDFDNRWMVFPQDFPSANYLLTQRITRVLVVRRTGTAIPDDLAHVLCRWHEAGIAIFQQDPAGKANAEPLTVKPPRGFRAAWHRFLAMLGLRRGSAGGFGSIVPQPSSSG